MSTPADPSQITEDEYTDALGKARQVAHQVTVEALTAELARAIAVNARLVALLDDARKHDVPAAAETDDPRFVPLNGERPAE